MALGGVLLAQVTDIDTGEGEALYADALRRVPPGDRRGHPGRVPAARRARPRDRRLEDGRTFPILVVLYGLAGAIEVHGQAYAGLMPPMGYLEDEEIADVLNFVATAWDNADDLDEGFEAYTPEEVAEQRGRGLTMDDVHAIRMELGLE
jgi:hypothetical protein